MDVLRKLMGLFSRHPKTSTSLSEIRCPACGVISCHRIEKDDAGGAARICNSCGEHFNATMAAYLAMDAEVYGDEDILKRYHRDYVGPLHEARVNLHGSTADIAKWISHKLIPSTGRAPSIQGELMRAIEELQREALVNLNHNWGKTFEAKIDFLESTLSKEPRLPNETITGVRKDLDVLRSGTFLEEGIIYVRLAEAVVDYCRLNPELKPNDTGHRTRGDGT